MSIAFQKHTTIRSGNIEMKCKNCKWWKGFLLNVGEKTQPGNCLATKPSGGFMHTSDYRDLLWQWPVTYEYEQCSGFTRKRVLK